MASEEEERDGASTVYKMKAVQFLGRAVPIILQNDNGPCPLLAISNVLLLRSNVTLNVDMMEISQRELMSLVAEWLLDANSNTQNKDDDFVKNQQQNIEDAIQLLPRLATGIDVNVRFTDIHDFEFTPECAIFDLFHVGLVHGWLCDPQDEATFRVIGSNSYNTLVEKLVAFQTMKAEEASQRAVVEDEPTVDFVAATIATLGIPSPKSCKRLSDDDFDCLNQIDGKTRRKGDDEEAAELLQALQLSQTDNDSVLRSSAGKGILSSLPSDESLSSIEDVIPQLELTSVVHVDKDGTESLIVENEAIATRPRPVLSLDEDIPEVLITSIVHVKKEEADCSVVTEEVLEQDFVLAAAETTKEVSEGVSGENQVHTLTLSLKPADGKDTSGRKDLDVVHGESSSSSGGQFESFSTSKGEERAGNEGNVSIFTVGEEVKRTVEPLDLDFQDLEDQNLSTSGSVGSSFEHIPLKEDKLSIDTGSGHLSEEAEDCASSGLDEDEPLYEGEGSLLVSRMTNIEDKEPLYEGECVAGGQAQGQVKGDWGEQHDRQRSEESASDDVTEGLIIENFLSSNASQLTYYGLFSLQDGLKNNELYVFFRNNHFSTLFKHDGQIYLLATDQGYLAQPDLVWEKLTEVDGDTVFATGSFQQFQVDQSSGVWNERDAVAATADFMSSQQMTGTNTEGASFNSDLQLAIALQQQELAQQQQQQQQQQSQQQQVQQQARLPSSAPPRSSQPSSRAPTIRAGRLVTGPARSTVPPPKPEKAKEKCTIM